MDRPSTEQDIKAIKMCLKEQIEATIINKGRVPVFDDSYAGKDSLYTVCSDYFCAKWLIGMTTPGIPGLNSKLVVLPQDAELPAAAMRVVVCVPTRQNNEFILAKMSAPGNQMSAPYVGRSKPKLTRKGGSGSNGGVESH